MARPSFKPTAIQRRQVATAAGAGMAHEEIAVAIGISRNTLEKHFAEELSTGALKKRLEVYNALFAAAKRGSSSAAKAYLALEPKLAAPPASPDAPKPAKAPKLGKKEQAAVDAIAAAKGTDWDSLLTPPALTQ